jgi:hypothetical protein
VVFHLQGMQSVCDGVDEIQSKIAGDELISIIFSGHSLEPV